MTYENRPNMIFNRDLYTRNFTYSSNYAEDYICKNISFEAWGIFHKMLSLPPTWHFNQESFSKMYNITPSKLRKNIKLLKEHGFIESKQERRKNGTKGDWIYTLNENPNSVILFKSQYTNNPQDSISNKNDNINENNLQFDNIIELRA